MLVKIQRAGGEARAYRLTIAHQGLGTGLGHGQVQAALLGGQIDLGDPLALTGHASQKLVLPVLG